MEKQSKQSKDTLRNWLLLIGLVFAILAIYFSDLDTGFVRQPASKETTPTTGQLQSRADLVSSAFCKIQTVVAKIGKGSDVSS